MTHNMILVKINCPIQHQESTFYDIFGITFFLYKTLTEIIVKYPTWPHLFLSPLNNMGHVVLYLKKNSS